MSDDRLFASNNAIGRKWYYINIVALILITMATKFVFEDYITPNIRTEAYAIISTWITYFAYAIYLITFFALIDRRLYDICGTRETKTYKNVSAILKLAVFIQIVVIIGEYKSIDLFFDYEIWQIITLILDFIFLTIVFVIGLIKGKISNLKYEEYKNRIKYR